MLDAAREACQSEDTTSAARTLKQLQQQWRQAPWVLPGVYRKMNKAFRHCCDTFFNAQQQQRKEQQAQRARAQASQQTILAELDQLLTQPPADGLQAQLDDALTRLEALEAADRELTTKARQRVARYRQQLRQWQAWQAVEDALRGLPEGTADDASLDLAVALEVCCQQPSPADQESRRLRWQVETLPRAMTGGGLPDRDTLLAMLREWLEGRAHVDKNVRTRLLHCIHSLAPAP